MTKPRQFCPRGHDTFKHGRDRGHRCLECRREDAEALLALEAAEAAEREAERRRVREEADRLRELEHRAAIKHGGYDAVMARWDRAYRESHEKTVRGLCQWEDEVDGQNMGRMCYHRTDDVYCWRHNRQLEREAAR